jgi:hypothetical protein
MWLIGAILIFWPFLVSARANSPPSTLINDKRRKLHVSVGPWSMGPFQRNEVAHVFASHVICRSVYILVFITNRTGIIITVRSSGTWRIRTRAKEWTRVFLYSLPMRARGAADFYVYRRATCYYQKPGRQFVTFLCCSEQ